MPKFHVVWTVEATIEIAEGVLKQAATDDTIREGGLRREQAVQHIAYNLVRNGLDLSQIDGFANRRNKEARLIDRVEWDDTDITEAP